MSSLPPQVAVVDFHHHRGPEVEFWVTPDGEALFKRNDWALMPFMALSDGAHTMIEDFSYFTLLNGGAAEEGAAEQAKQTSLFGIACTRQIKSDQLKKRSPDVTRSTVQKAVVVVVSSAQGLGELRERLGAVTAAWFRQEDFTDTTILKEFQESLSKNQESQQVDSGHYLGLSLREMIHEFRHQTLVLFKCMLLQRKMLFFGSKCERLCMMQFALISLIPGLTRDLQDCADPALDAHAQGLTRAATLKTSERSSVLAYMGLPLQIFGKGSFFGPYTPLQQLDILADYDTKSYLVGSTNSLLLQQKEKYSDILINLDESNSITILSSSLRTALTLTAADRRWIDQLTQTVLDTWDPENPSRPKNLGFAGSEDAIRSQFEEYILSLLSSMAYHVYHEGLSGPTRSNQSLPDPGEAATDFNPEFLASWRDTNNFSVFDKLTHGSRIFDIIEPKHPTAGSLNIEDVQRRLQQGLADLHLDERVKEGRQQLGQTIAIGRERFGQGLNKLWENVEALRERRSERSQTRENSDIDNQSDRPYPTEDGAPLASPTASIHTQDSKTSAAAGASWTSSLRERAAKVQRPDTTQIQAAARDNAAKAGAYLSSWGSWARDRGREWQESRKPPSGSTSPSATLSPTTASFPVTPQLGSTATAAAVAEPQAKKPEVEDKPLEGLPDKPAAPEVKVDETAVKPSTAAVAAAPVAKKSEEEGEDKKKPAAEPASSS